MLEDGRAAVAGSPRVAGVDALPARRVSGRRRRKRPGRTADELLPAAARRSSTRSSPRTTRPAGCSASGRSISGCCPGRSRTRPSSARRGSTSGTTTTACWPRSPACGRSSPGRDGPHVHGAVAPGDGARAWRRSRSGAASASGTAAAGSPPGARRTARYVLVTSDGEYRCRAAVFALGVTEPWKSPIPGIEDVPHYVETRKPRASTRARRVVVIGKRNSGFEIADGLVPWARQIILVSPRPVQTAVLALSSVRVRYFAAARGRRPGAAARSRSTPSVERIERTASGGYSVHATGRRARATLARGGRRRSRRPGSARRSRTCRSSASGPSPRPDTRADAVLGGHGVAGRLLRGEHDAGRSRPAQARCRQQPRGPCSGFRYNARVLAREIAERHFGHPAGGPQPGARRGRSVPRRRAGPRDPRSGRRRHTSPGSSGSATSRADRASSHWPISSTHRGPDAVAATIEMNASGEIYPVVYVRRGGDRDRARVAGAADEPLRQRRLSSPSWRPC